MFYLVACASILALSGCETHEQRFERLLPKAEQRCGQFGYKQGTSAYADCLKSEVSRMEKTEDELAAAFAEGIAEGIEESQQAQVTCVTTGSAYYSTTTCN